MGHKLTILFEFYKNFKITSFSMRKWQKTGPLQLLFSSNAPPLVLFCIETVQKAGHWLLKYN